MLRNPDIRVFSTVNVHRKDGGKPGSENAQRKTRQSDAKFSLWLPKFLSHRKGVPPAAEGAQSLWMLRVNKRPGSRCGRDGGAGR